MRNLGLLYSVTLHIFIGSMIFLNWGFKNETNNQPALVPVDIINVTEIRNIPVNKKQISSNEKKAPDVVNIDNKYIKKDLNQLIDKKDKVLKKTNNLPKTIKTMKKVIPLKKEEASKKTAKPIIHKKDIFHDEKFIENLAKEAQKNKITKDLEQMMEGLDSEDSYDHKNPLAVSEIDNIKNQIQKVWNTSSFSGSTKEKMRVTLSIKLNQNGEVLNATPQKYLGSSPNYKVFVDSAIRAAYMASPLQNLPVEKYRSWEYIDLNFDSNGFIDDNA